MPFQVGDFCVLVVEGVVVVEDAELEEVVVGE
jgi:hypothetical protein